MMELEVFIMESVHSVMEKLLQDYQRLLKEELKRSSSDLTQVLYKILYEAYLHEGLSIKEMANKLATDLTTFSRQVQTLEKSEFISRLPNRQDRRIIQLYLTEKGRMAVESVIKNVENRIVQTLNDMNEFEEETIIRSIIQLSKKMRGT
jgi:DNA-binding MarR family transcriptional regulator